MSYVTLDGTTVGASWPSVVLVFWMEPHSPGREGWLALVAVGRICM